MLHTCIFVYQKQNAQKKHVQTNKPEIRLLPEEQSYQGMFVCFLQQKITATSKVEINKKILRKNVYIFLPISFNIYFGYSKEPSH